ncbi:MULTISPECIES: hypothetical protein [Streptomyces]|uniref:Uncharacterized protein n=1 Tax=Streptomyces formicae TaxID=1616117 RepID=A0ABY3WM11_9ACTN|nr:hypothetical protein [Streptomyces formicae]UNM13636.1 hypothetical protein J4032_21135 [Streptomyces formicae]
MVVIAVLVPVLMMVLMFALEVLEDVLFPPSAPGHDSDRPDEQAPE